MSPTKSARRSPSCRYARMVSPIRASGCENSAASEGTSLPTKGTASSRRDCGTLPLPPPAAGVAAAAARSSKLPAPARSPASLAGGARPRGAGGAPGAAAVPDGGPTGAVEAPAVISAIMRSGSSP